jgi:DNA integrity scanning protein DisA with diadenylate cyclase activity
MGGLIVLSGKVNLDEHVQTGELLDARINSRLIENIFFKNSPLHDGAMIVSKEKILAASCILPVSKNTTVPKRLGLRHRAALGITEQTDAIAIIVSEETGRISYAVNGELNLNVKAEELEMFLSQSVYSIE